MTERIFAIKGIMPRRRWRTLLVLEALDAHKAHRDRELNNRNLIGSFLAALNHLHLATGQEVIQ